MQQEFRYPFSQRWREGRTSFRPSREMINPAEYGVEPLIDGRSAVVDFVRQHHYSRQCCPQKLSIGLFRKTGLARSRLAGVAVFCQGSNFRNELRNSITAWTGLRYGEGVELGRFVLLDECEGNAESWFLARARVLLKEHVPEAKVILSYSDPVPRQAADGRLVLVGHTGCCYQSSNAVYMGRASRKKQILDSAGREVSRRSIQKFLGGECGEAYALADLEERAGVVFTPGESREDFVRRALTRLRVRSHPGNHLYVFALGTPAERRSILALPMLSQAQADNWSGVLPYPKQVDDMPAETAA